MGRHLKSLMADIVVQTSRGLMDQGELSKLCTACEANGALSRVFDLVGLTKFVDEGSGSTSQVGEVEKRKADVVDAVVAELYQKRAANETANEALDMLVAFIYDAGRASGTCCDLRSDGQRPVSVTEEQWEALEKSSEPATEAASVVVALLEASVNGIAPPPQQKFDKNSLRWGAKR